MQRYEVHRGIPTSKYHRGDCNEVTGDQQEAISVIGSPCVPPRQAEHCLTLSHNLCQSLTPSLPRREYHQAHQPLKSSVSWCHSVWALIYNIFNIPPEGRAGQLVLLIIALVANGLTLG